MKKHDVEATGVKCNQRTKGKCSTNRMAFRSLLWNIGRHGYAFWEFAIFYRKNFESIEQFINKVDFKNFACGIDLHGKMNERYK